MLKIDLHTHTVASDGKNTPAQNVQLAHQKGLAALAITDHDTVGGIEEALEAGKWLGLEVVPGIEISTLANGQDIHVLGYFIDYQHTDLDDELRKLRATRNERNRMMIEKLNDLGIEITLEEVEQKQTHQEGNVGRPHIAEVLMEKGVVASLDEAFDEYLGREGKAFVNPPRISPAEGVRLIKRFRGVPVLAHPGLYKDDVLICDLIREGIKGIEVFHPDHSPLEVKKYQQMAAQLNLIMTGGSDYHGTRNGEVYHADLGSQPVPASVLDQIKSYL